ncbi:MAG TPA: response regulator transcription factor [Burkholderiaceae bacterium]
MANEEQIRLLVVDDHPVVRTGLVEILRSDGGLHVAAQAGSGQEAIDRFSAIRPDVVLMDLRMPDMGGVEAIERIRQLDPEARIIIVTAVDGEDDIYRGLRAGANSYILKDAPPTEVIEAVRMTMQGHRYLAQSVAAKLADHLDSNQLSERETEILQWIATGLSNKGIARKAGITEGTVKFHVNNILSKLKCASRTEAVALAIKRGLIRLT